MTKGIPEASIWARYLVLLLRMAVITTIVITTIVITTEEHIIDHNINAVVLYVMAQDYVLFVMAVRWLQIPLATRDYQSVKSAISQDCVHRVMVQVENNQISETQPPNARK